VRSGNNSDGARRVGIEINRVEIVGIEGGGEAEVIWIFRLGYRRFQFFLGALLGLGDLLFLPLPFLLALEKCGSHRNLL
jgi:hypothetical protein